MSSQITILVAHDDNLGIGYQGKLPWKCLAELTRFKERTLGHLVIMGRKTWEHLPIKPLPDRINGVMTTNHLKFYMETGTPAFNDIAEAIKYYEWCPKKELFVIGGKKVYNSFLTAGVVNRIIASHIYGTHKVDTYFRIPPGWQPTERIEFKEFTETVYIND